MRFSVLGATAIAAALLWGPRARATPPRAVSASGLVQPGDPVFGNPHGSITIVDFYDTSCLPCRAMNQRIERLIARDPQIRYVPIDMPILGAQSELAAKALVAAARQGRFPAMQQRLLTQSHLPTPALLRADAASLGFNMPRFERDLASAATARAIAARLRWGATLGIHYVPIIYIGRNRIPGSMSYKDLLWLVAHAHQQLLTEVATPPAHS
ncbi:MAG: thioredoxin domain-containing protein [Acidiphilium sp.]|nr:thioredoxin domain-containing protein [Acidiphilium sp.]MDD4935860.1 thioredoxin domain-containing protein [Acidiphilium sp.]